MRDLLIIGGCGVVSGLASALVIDLFLPFSAALYVVFAVAGAMMLLFIASADERRL